MSEHPDDREGRDVTEDLNEDDVERCQVGGEGEDEEEE